MGRKESGSGEPRRVRAGRERGRLLKRGPRGSLLQLAATGGGDGPLLPRGRFLVAPSLTVEVPVLGPVVVHDALLALAAREPLRTLRGVRGVRALSVPEKLFAPGDVADTFPRGGLGSRPCLLPQEISILLVRLLSLLRAALKVSLVLDLVGLPAIVIVADRRHRWHA